MMTKYPTSLGIYLAVYCITLCLLAGRTSAQVPSLRAFHQSVSYLPANSIYQHSQELNYKRKNWVTGLAIGGYTSMMLYMGTVWYAKEELSPFHFFDDSREWKQMDKFGHVLGAYHQTRLMIEMYRWAGVSKKKALWLSGFTGFLAQSSIEIFDGFAKKWGASVSDIGANFVGAAFAMANYQWWNESRLQIKMSYIPSSYTKNPDFDRLFGSNFPERLLKDYNGQTYWLSIRLHSFLPESRFKDIYPPWLNLALGYGANGLEGGYGIDPWETIQAREYRQFYLSLDIDLANIHTRSGFLNSLFSVVNMIRIPLPALQIDKHGLAFRVF